jgi:hypothetical protein
MRVVKPFLLKFYLRDVPLTLPAQWKSAAEKPTFRLEFI